MEVTSKRPGEYHSATSLVRGVTSHGINELFWLQTDIQVYLTTVNTKMTIVDSPGQSRNYGYYGPNSVTWKIGSESIVLLGGARAVLMQLAHPLVAMGVSTHSDYMTDPFGRTERTFILGELLTFGSLEKARQAARTINRLHLHVHGNSPIDAGVFPKGTPYNARNPELLLWVHATLVDTLLLCYTHFVGPLSPAEQDRYYQESKGVATLLGLLPDKMPGTLDDLERYIQDMLNSDLLVATPQARQLANQILFPPAPSILRPFMHFNLQLTCALLPQPIREIYGLEWNNNRQYVFDLTAKGLRAIIPRLPVSYRKLPITRRLMQETTGYPND